MNQDNNKFICPHCHSGNIGKCSVVYKNGVTRHNYTSEISGTIGYDVFNPQYFSGEMETTGISTTDLARRCAPPRKPKEGTILDNIAFLALFVTIFPHFPLDDFIFSNIFNDAGIIGNLIRCLGIFVDRFIEFCSNHPSVFILWIVIFFYIKWSVERQIEKEKIYEQRYRDWCNSYICFRCGNIFVIN